MAKLVLVRHGESVWNKENKFTGWTDVELSERGIQEAKEAGQKIKEANIEFEIAYSSVLKRAKDTLEYILEETNNKDLPRQEKWRLNERHYGALQGLNKAETAKKYGEDQVLLWRRSTTVRPPELAFNDPRYPGNDPKYAEIPNSEIPKTENLIDTIERVKKFFVDHVIKRLKEDKNVLIVAHGNSIRALINYLKELDEHETILLEIPTGKPLVLELDKELKVKKDYYL